METPLDTEVSIAPISNSSSSRSTPIMPTLTVAEACPSHTLPLTILFLGSNLLLSTLNFFLFFLLLLPLLLLFLLPLLLLFLLPCSSPCLLLSLPSRSPSLLQNPSSLPNLIN